MTILSNKIHFLTSLSCTVLVLGACSSNIKKSDISATADPAQEIASLEQGVQEGYKNHVDVLSPEEFDKTNDFIAEAKKDLDKKKDQSEIIEDIAYATSYMKKAQANALSRRAQIEDVLVARSAALDAGVNKHKAERDRFDKLSDELKEASGNFKKKLSPDDISRIQREFIGLEVASISARELGDARAKISASVDGDAEDRVPNTLKQAQTDLRTAENVLSQNSKNPAAYRESVQKANASATFLMAALSEAKKNGKKTTESVAVQLAKQNQKIGSLESSLGQSEDNVVLQKAIENARREFSKDEAEVFQQDNKLLIRLKTMNFPVGRAELPQGSLDTLAKVNSVIQSLEVSKVVVEGHTDSTGTVAVNQKVSQERADAVAKYLESSGAKVEDLTAVGFGYKKPLASNKNKAGRESNRRVDVIVTVAKTKTTDNSEENYAR